MKTLQSRGGTPADGPSEQQWWRSSTPLFAAGGAAIVAGGLAAAVTGPTEWGHGSWTAAFLVLVMGVAQIGLGAGQARLAAAPPSMDLAVRQCALWNGGGLAVIAGTLLTAPVAVSIGSAALFAALGLSAFAVRRTGEKSALLLLYRTLLIVLLVSIPIGTALAWVRH
jgi:hypothetical protein